jgi:divalent metal cation (Fe/Co/Zn/Cd) transporter
MKLECSKISNKGDLMALVGLLVLVAVLGLALAMAVYVDAFAAGFFSATILWKWYDWLYKPMDAWLDKLWAENNQS